MSQQHVYQLFDREEVDKHLQRELMKSLIQGTELKIIHS